MAINVESINVELRADTDPLERGLDASAAATERAGSGAVGGGFAAMVGALRDSGMADVAV